MTTEANEGLIESWRLALHAKRPRTVTLYLEEVRRFADWLEGNGRPEQLPGDLLTIDRTDARAWVGAAQDGGLSGWTVRSRWIAMRSFYRWLVDEEELDVSPFAKVVVDKPQTPAPDVLDEAGCHALLKACEGTTFLDRRDLALIRFMLATGLRLSEVVAIRPGDLELSSRLAHVRDGKGGRYRAVRYDPATASAIDRYKRIRARHRLAGLDWLWITHHGPLTRKGLPTILAKRGAIAGLEHVHPHQLRHTWAHRLKSAGIGDENLRHLGGWESAEVMKRYGEALAVDRALAAYDTVNPMGNL